MILFFYKLSYRTFLLICESERAESRVSQFPLVGSFPKCPQLLGMGQGQSLESGIQSRYLVWIVDFIALEPSLLE